PLQHDLVAKIALHEIHPGNRIHGQNVRRDDAARAADDARGILAPAARRGAQIHAADARLEQPLAPLDLGELEHRARAPSLALRALDELVAGMFGQPACAAFRTLGHDVRALRATIMPPCSFRKSKKSICAAWRILCAPSSCWAMPGSRTAWCRRWIARSRTTNWSK